MMALEEPVAPPKEQWMDSGEKWDTDLGKHSVSLDPKNEWEGSVILSNVADETLIWGGLWETRCLEDEEQGIEMIS